jgi:tetratricopeptide (TPR) repeat protein
MFLEKRVYQGSSGRVYPLPYCDRISTEPEDRSWNALHIENEFLRVMILPEIGGRIHLGYDKVSGYDFFYRQNVIKPALVGLAGPWASGGVEFNWPQHHRPATFMPVSTEIEYEEDGSVTLWCSDHDPMLRMKGMHGVRLRPGRSLLELRVRLYNRTPLTQTFLWWANVATRVHEDYQSFFPTDVRHVADHAKRAITSFPFSDRPYYGVDYPERARSGVPPEERPAQFMPNGSYAPNDLSRYGNIPVPTSYMIAGSSGDFLGGYDHARDAGVVHVANHHIAPGKKQWTWGNHEFGYAWDRNLTDSDGPYIELMAGVYTDNQPDFSFLAPWETKTFTQSWYPIHAIGVPQNANTHAAVRLQASRSEASVGLQVTENHDELTLVLRCDEQDIVSKTIAARVHDPLLLTLPLPSGVDPKRLSVSVYEKSKLLIGFNPAAGEPAKPPLRAQEPADPERVQTIEELYLIGLHLDQYRHATRSPQPYWEEALRRDPDDTRTHNALGLWRLRRGEFADAQAHFEQAIKRLTALNPNPYDGEAYYNLGITLRFQGELKGAYDALYKSTWNSAWRGPAYFALAEIDCAHADWTSALDHLRRTLRAEADHLNAHNLLALTLRALGHADEAQAEIQNTRKLDPMDIGSRWQCGVFPDTSQEHLDLAFDLMRSGFRSEAVTVLENAVGSVGPFEGTLPIIYFALSTILNSLGDSPGSASAFDAGETASLDYCFPSRLEEMLVLEETLRRYPESASAAYLLGNLYYDRRRYDEAITLWRRSAATRPEFPTVWRNLGIALFNVRGAAAEALTAFETAFNTSSGDARLLYELDQLRKRLGQDPGVRLASLEAHTALVSKRDDLIIEKVMLLNQLGRPEDAMALLMNRDFQPWEGGEGLALGQYVRANVLLGRLQLNKGDPLRALSYFTAAKQSPRNLSEAKHLLVNQSDLDFWIGEAYSALGDQAAARTAWQRAATHKGDFQQMSVRATSDMTYWTGMAQLRLGDLERANATFKAIAEYAESIEGTTPKIDYFATSLPTMLLFEDDLVKRHRMEVSLLKAQALVGTGDRAGAACLLREILTLDKNHTIAADLLASVVMVPEEVG